MHHSGSVTAAKDALCGDRMSEPECPRTGGDLSDRNDAMRQTLRVTALGDGYVELEGDRAAGCASCASRSSCGSGALAELIGGKQHLRLRQTLPLSVGDEVVVAMESSAFLGAMTRAYLVPPAALCVVAAVSASLGLSDVATALLCVPALALSALPLVRADRRERAGSALRIEGLANPGPGSGRG
ncbi:SoxR reducing system RseC family protein [Tropicimonas sp. IMCC34043]|uniref:SoxR reducing system RseC family protein n=1 Tax=Tropicimonas sp. IMCC34043 TaxID=2248760 RepID=UPI0013001A0D|nr:SoxR reducing system RseC family protein [Tropicimonas sp. IMCC34043]